MLYSSMRVIGLAGRKYAGKDTAASALLVRGWARLAFADPLRDAVKALFMLSDADCTNPVSKERPGPMGVSYRRAAQILGTEVFRQRLAELWPEAASLGCNFWVEHLRRRVRERSATAPGVVVTDVRFPNEVALIKQMGGIVVYVERPGNLGGDAHESESHDLRALADYILRNDSSFEDLHAEFLALLRDAPK